MEYFVDKHSIVRKIWGKSDTILFIFAGASAEFALNKAIDWLYYTGRLPADPLGRLFSTVSYARAIVFSEKQAALRAIDAMTAIHAGVESKRGTTIPDWAYRDVLFMLIDYSIRAFEKLEHALSLTEKNEVFNVFHAIGTRMRLNGLPNTLEAWEKMRQDQLSHNMIHSILTDDLFSQYRKHLGAIRYQILLEVQTSIVPAQVRDLLHFRKISILSPLLAVYNMSRMIKADWLLLSPLLPARYKKEIQALNNVVQ